MALCSPSWEYIWLHERNLIHLVLRVSTLRVTVIVSHLKDCGNTWPISQSLPTRMPLSIGVIRHKPCRQAYVLFSPSIPVSLHKVGGGYFACNFFTSDSTFNAMRMSWGFCLFVWNNHKFGFPTCELYVHSLIYFIYIYIHMFSFNYVIPYVLFYAFKIHMTTIGSWSIIDRSH